MAMMTRNDTTDRRVLYLWGGMFFVAAALVVPFMLVGSLARLLFVALLPLSVWGAHRAREAAVRARCRREVAARLRRLPADFTVLQDLVVPAPWGPTRVPYLVLSRFGVVVGGEPSSPWMLERVEAVRSFLFTRGLLFPGMPVQPLILLPPGRGPVMADAPAVRVERLTLEHLAPGGQTCLNPAQVQAIARALIHPDQTPRVWRSA